jgi:predicted transcriptional regulator
MSKRREQIDLLRWLAAIQHMSATFGDKEKYMSRKPKRFKDPISSTGTFTLDSSHYSVWQSLVAMAHSLVGNVAHTWCSYSKLSFYAGIPQSKLNDVLEDLISIGMVAKQHRPGRQSNVTYIFTTPLKSDETCEERIKALDEVTDLHTEEGKDHNMSLPDSPVAKAHPPKVAALEPLSDDNNTLILNAILRAFSTPPCLCTVKEQVALTKRFPIMVRLAGSPLRLWSLFACIEDDTAATSMKLKVNVQKAKVAWSYLEKCLPHWLVDYSAAIDAFIAKIPRENVEEDV